MERPGACSSYRAAQDLGADALLALRVPNDEDEVGEEPALRPELAAGVAQRVGAAVVQLGFGDGAGLAAQGLVEGLDGPAGSEVAGVHAAADGVGRGLARAGLVGELDAEAATAVAGVPAQRVLGVGEQAVAGPDAEEDVRAVLPEEGGQEGFGEVDVDAAVLVGGGDVQQHRTATGRAYLDRGGLNRRAG